MNSISASQTQSDILERQQIDILIVDDVPDNIRFLSAFLMQQGYQVRKAINGKMALGSVTALIPDLILLDVNLPDMSGYEVCEELKQNRSTASIPIIFLSAENNAIDKVKAFQLGASDYITKPFQLEEVLARINTQLTIQTLQKELKEQNQQLKETLVELKAAQANLVQQEKMATLRKVVAGVAHEINNPLSFIACNIKPIQEYVQQLLTLIQLYQQESENHGSAVRSYLEEIDLEFLSSDLMSIIHSMEKGTERIHSVILALRIFTRLDEAGIKPIDINDTIDQVLALLQHRFCDQDGQVLIQIRKEYGKLPLVTGYADQLNQVIFNLVCNSIDAIDEKMSRNNGQFPAPEIVITTQLSTNTDSILIRIRDNGVGVPDAIRDLIFEPFFTTKPAGQGVGLGLATSRRIIEEIHFGQLTYHSSPGEGAEFVIQLPI